ncbi:MAG: hypothetical protein ACTSRP_25000 [Candidatus Helarchaeota archaeon]
MFFFIISIFGWSITSIIQKKTNDWELKTLENLFLSFGIGLTFYIIICYICDTFQTFNYFTVILPIVIYDIIYLFYSIFITKSFHFIFKNQKSKKNGISILIIIIGIVILYYRIQSTIFKNSAYFLLDPYAWAYSVFYLLEHQYLSASFFAPTYPQGFTFYCAGNLLLIKSNFTIEYMFMKFGFFIIFIYYIILIYIISNRIFPEHEVFSFYCILMLLAHNYLIYRTIMFLPSSIANFLILICMLILLTKVPNYLLGLIIPTIYLFHNLSLFYFLLILFILYAINIIKNSKEKIIIKEILKEIIIIIFLCFILLIPYFINAYIRFNIDLISMIKVYFHTVGILSIMEENSNKFLTIYLILIDNVNQFINLLNFKSLEFLYKKTIEFFFIFGIFGLFINYNKKKEEFKDFILFLKIGIILILLIFYFFYFFLNNNHFYYVTRYRILENFSFIVIILSAIFIEWFFDKLNVRWNSRFLKLKIKKVNFKIKKCKKMYKITFQTLMFFFFCIFSFFYVINREGFYYYYYNSIYYNENIIYINQHIPKGSHIGVRDLSEVDQSNNPHFLLYNYKLFYYSAKENYSNYYKFVEFCENYNIDYVILKLTFFNESNLVLFLNSTHFKKIYTPLERDWIYGIYKFIE